MSSIKIPNCPLHNPGDSHHAPARPQFNHQNTRDRLREAAKRPYPLSMISNLRKDRRSVFKEVGLESEDVGAPVEHMDEKPAALDLKEVGQTTGLAPLDTSAVEQGSTTDSDQGHTSEKDDSGRGNEKQVSQLRRSDSTSQPATSPPQSPTTKMPWYAKLGTGRRSRVRTTSSASPSPLQGLSTLTLLAVVLALMVPFSGRGSQDAGGLADAGPISIRADSPTDVCARWAHQVALLNGTLYIYGGEAKSTMDQVNNTWNNDFLTVDLASSWKTTSPSLSGLSQPNGPPAVALGILWHDYNNLYLYGGEFADNPYVEPAAVATWKYTISDSTWTQYSDLTTSAGNNSASGGVAVQRAAEGAGVSVPELGLSWYLGGHLDLSTTPGWSDQVTRVYLKSLLEFTHPGYTNDGVYALARGSGAPASGTYRNITQGGLQSSDAFTERADGVLVFVPGWGADGVLIGLGGGTATDFTNDMSTLDVYDIASSQWYHQQTTGTAPGVRVNPCAVIASAPDASSFQIYLFGGQNLQPAGDQIQYNDMYILTIPSFTWIGPISQSGSNIPFARAGHTCTLRDGQMVLVGGFNTTVTTCDSPGIYVYNASSLQWLSSFTRLSPSPNLDPGNTVLGSSYGYTVPDVVVSVIGGSPAGSATVTTPAASATGGPFATGTSPVFTITASGSTATITSPGHTAASSPSLLSEDRSGLIAAIVIACVAGAAAGYLGYCAWLYRRQVRAYKTHLAVTNRFPARSASHGNLGRILAFGRRPGTGDKVRGGAATTAGEKFSWLPGYRRDASAASSADGDMIFSWVGRDRENLLDPNSAKVTPSSGSELRSTSSPWGPFGDDKYGSSYGSGSGPGSVEASGSGAESRRQRRGSGSGGSTSSAEDLLEGQQPSFFSVVMGPRRALRVVNGLEDGEGH